MALSHSVRHMIWTRNALMELKQSYKAVLHSDSNGAIDLAKNNKVCQRSKHINIKYHFVRSHVGTTFSLEFIPSQNYLADLLTKQLAKPTHQRLTNLVRCSSEGKYCKN